MVFLWLTSQGLLEVNHTLVNIAPGKQFQLHVNKYCHKFN